MINNIIKQFSLIFYIIFLGGSLEVYCQCNSSQKWRTIGYEDPNTNLVLYFPLIFDIKKDSIFVRNANPKMDHQQVKYSIISSKCSWDIEELTGHSEYKVYIIESAKNASIIIESNNGKGTLRIIPEGIEPYNLNFEIQKIITVPLQKQH